MYSGSPDLLSYILYFALGFFFVYITEAIKTQRVGINRFQDPVYKNFWAPAMIFIAVFTFVAVYRKVGLNLGGADSLGYIEWFERSNTETAESHMHGMFAEPLYHYICQVCRSITSDYHLLFAVVYFSITFSYVFFLKKCAPSNFSSIPLILMMYPYLKSFCTIRTSLAFAFILVGLAIVRSHNKKSIITGIALIVASPFIHRMCIPYLLVVPYLFLVNKNIIVITKNSFLFGGLSLLLLSYMLSVFFSDNYSSMVFEGADTYYAEMHSNLSFWANWPRILPYLMLYLAYYYMYDRIKWDRQKEYIRNLFFFDLILMPVAIFFNLWRFNEIFYIVRMLSWGIIIWTFSYRAPEANKKIFKFLFLIIFMAWLYIRIDHEWDELKIMPYILDISNLI